MLLLKHVVLLLVVANELLALVLLHLQELHQLLLRLLLCRRRQSRPTRSRGCMLCRQCLPLLQVQTPELLLLAAVVQVQLVHLLLLGLTLVVRLEPLLLTWSLLLGAQ